MISFKEYINEGHKNLINDITGANTEISRKSNSGKFFVIRKWTDEEKENTITKRDSSKSIYKWNIVDNIKPDYKTSFPIDEMKNYLGDYTTKIQVKYALRDIGQNIWKPEE